MSPPDRPVARHLLPPTGVLLKVAVGATLFYVIARYVDISEALRQIGRADPRWFIAATALILAQHVFAAMRWCAVARAIGCQLPFRQALIGYIEANFFNQAMPSTIGGDTARVWRATRAGLSLGAANNHDV